MSNPIPVTPEEGVAMNLAAVDQKMRDVNRDLPPEAAMAFMSLAQVSATCALVHAVRQLTDEIRQSRETA